MKKRKIAAAAAAAMLALSLSGCGGSPEAAPAQAETVAERSADTQPKETAAAASAETTAADTSASEVMDRSVKNNTAEDDTWTIFVYLCGADLESENGMATIDIAEMASSTAGENIKFVVQTGGASKWNADFVSPDKAQRFVIYGGDGDVQDESGVVNMGDSSSLADFLHWGLSEYPAAKTGLILWDHGSGSINGVCFDELNSGDSLLLREIDAALYSVKDEMPGPFEFIGFDACLMASVEAASVLSEHADYMVASEETEPGYGWNYTEIGNFLGSNPSADGKELGKVICDSFYDDCSKIGAENGATLSVTDLSKIKSFSETFDAYAKDIYDLTYEPEKFADTARAIKSADNFGGNNKSSGYTNMVDAGGLISAGKKYSGNADKALALLSDAVVYKKNGADHKNASGLSMYYPLQLQGSQELKIFKDICISPYYLAFVDKIAYGAVNSGNIEGYDNSELIGSYSESWDESDFQSGDGDYVYEPEDDGYWNDYDFEPTGESGAISFDAEPFVDDDGSYCFVLSEEGLNNTDAIEGVVYMLSDDLDYMLELGYTGEVSGDYETGLVVDGFSGYWFSLSDEQYVAAYRMSTCDGYDLYSSPILLNGEETNLIFAHDYNTDEVMMIGVWDGISENGSASRSDTELKEGDIITPMYSASAVEGDEEEWFYGDEYTYDGSDEMCFTELLDGEYIYSFIIYDIYGDYYITDFINITVEGDKIYYTEL